MMMEADSGVMQQLQVQEHQGHCQSHRKLGGGKKGFFPRAFREHGPVDTLVSDFYPLIELTN